MTKKDQVRSGSLPDQISRLKKPGKLKWLAARRGCFLAAILVLCLLASAPSLFPDRFRRRTAVEKKYFAGAAVRNRSRAPPCQPLIVDNNDPAIAGYFQPAPPLPPCPPRRHLVQTNGRWGVRQLWMMKFLGILWKPFHCHFLSSSIRFRTSLKLSVKGLLRFSPQSAW